jgi:ankyrin repeat protein
VTILVDHTLKRGESFPAAVYNRLLLRCGPDTDANLLRLVTDITTETTESKALWSGIIAQAAPAGNSDLVELALERGGTCPHETSEGINPFLEAIKSEHPDTVKLLLEARASPSQADCRGRNALHLACHIKETKYKSLSVVQGDRSKQLMVQELLQHGAQINARDNDGNTALHFAVVTGDFELVRGLISLGASVNIRNNRGETTLHSAVSTWVFPEIVEHLLHKGACASAQDLEGYTPLHKIRERRGECDRAVELLINHGADVSIRAHNGDLAIHRAVGRGNYTLFLALQRSGARIHEKGSRGMTALHIAAKKGKVSFIDPLVKAGADVDAVNDRGRTAAYYAGQRGDQELIDELVKHSNLKKGTDSNPFVKLVEQ